MIDNIMTFCSAFWNQKMPSKLISTLILIVIMLIVTGVSLKISFTLISNFFFANGRHDVGKMPS